MKCVYLVLCRSANYREPFSTLAVCATPDAAKKWVSETLEWLTFARGYGVNSCHLDAWDTVVDCDGDTYLSGAISVDEYPFNGKPVLELKITQRYVIE